MEIAMGMYPVDVKGGLGTELEKLIIEKVCFFAKTGKRTSNCTGFCKKLNLPREPKCTVESIPPETRHVMSRLILATLGSYQVNQPESRQMRKVDDTKAPITTDGFVGLCCKSMMKLCESIKLNMLWPAKSENG